MFPRFYDSISPRRFIRTPKPNPKLSQKISVQKNQTDYCTLLGLVEDPQIKPDLIRIWNPTDIWYAKTSNITLSIFKCFSFDAWLY